MNWNERLRAAREAHGSKKIDVARAANVAPSTVTDWESGETTMIDGEHLISVSMFLGVSASWLITGHGAMKPVASIAQPDRQPRLQRVTHDEDELLDLYRSCGIKSQQLLLTIARNMPRDSVSIRNHQG